MLERSPWLQERPYEYCFGGNQFGSQGEGSPSAATPKGDGGLSLRIFASGQSRLNVWRLHLHSTCLSLGPRPLVAYIGVFYTYSSRRESEGGQACRVVVVGAGEPAAGGGRPWWSCWPPAGTWRRERFLDSPTMDVRERRGLMGFTFYDFMSFLFAECKFATNPTLGKRAFAINALTTVL